MNPESRIQTYRSALVRFQAEVKIMRSALKDAMSADPVLVPLQEKATEAKRLVTLQKQALMNEPEHRAVDADLKELAKEIKEAKQSLGDELLAYFMENQRLEVTDSKGAMRRFRVSASLTSSRPEEN